MSVIKREYKFAFAHRNLNLEGKCARVHGHTGRFAVTVIAPKNEASGVSVEFKDIDAAIDPVVNRYDHFLLLHEKDPLCALLSEAGEAFVQFKEPPSAENIAEVLKQDIMRAANGLFDVVSLEFKETDSSTIIT